jgi:hypothetical protein
VLLRFGTQSDPKPAEAEPKSQPVAKPQPQPIPEPEQYQEPEPEIELEPYYPPQTTVPPPVPPEAIPDEIDWIAVGLGLAAVLSVGGLIPFWLMIYLTFFPPVR